MKSLILSTCFFLVSITLFAQTVADTGSVTETKPDATTTEVSAATVKAHNKLAFAQIGAHLAEHLGYPAEMTELALEGTVTAAVVLSSKGKIARITIAKADLPKAFHLELITTMRSLKKLELKGSNYLGDKVLYVPVRFSL